MSERNVAIRTALLSVTDKAGIVELAQVLVSCGVRLVSTGGTRAVLVQAGLPVTEISEITGNPEAFGGRIKTISFQVASGLLFDRDRDAAEALRLQIAPIDLVVANLYDFVGNSAHNLPDQELIEHIDIGGPTMIRAAAKNFRDVAVLTSPAQYTAFISELQSTSGHTSLASRRTWMAAAFALTARYDAAIAEKLGGQTLRYGENPHQTALFLPNAEGTHFDQLAGKELSYNNLVDLDAALAAAFGLNRPACAIVKHENPCGLASCEEVDALLALAWAGDPLSAFGSVIAFNRAVTAPMLSHLELGDKDRRKFVEIVAAPDFDAAALVELRKNKNLRVLQVTVPASAMRFGKRNLTTGTLVQSADDQLRNRLEVVSVQQPEVTDTDLVDFGLHAVRCLKSNAIALVRRSGGALQLLGMGAGQPNRLKATELAVTQALTNLAHELPQASGAQLAQLLGDCVLTSDAFFPFADGPQVALDAGVRCVVEPGGSLRDPEVIAACDRAHAVLFFTGTRHFRH